MNEIYCPVCDRFIEPTLREDGAYVYEHDDVEHTDEDFDELFGSLLD